MLEAHMAPISAEEFIAKKDAQYRRDLESQRARSFQGWRVMREAWTLVPQRDNPEKVLVVERFRTEEGRLE
jgi:hypothetical protein